VNTNNETALYEHCYRNENNLKTITRIYERASLVPAAAVIPALIVYIIIAAVKKLVVGSEPNGDTSMMLLSLGYVILSVVCLHGVDGGLP
jgi:hydrogenase-4 membrane subunit HyfE